MSSEVLAAILGALLAGGVHTVVSIVDRKRENESVLVAIACEVETICHLVRQQDYHGEISRLLRQVELGSLSEAKYVIDIRSDYFSVYHALSSQLGRLAPDKVGKIVRFYGVCKTIVDGTRPDGVAAQLQGRLQSVDSLRALKAGIDALLTLGDDIVQYPKLPISQPGLSNDR